MVARSVLIADDHADSRAIYATVLRHHGYAVFEAADGQEALALTEAAIPSLIVTDLHMPSVDGCSLIRALKEQATTASIPIMVVTAETRTEARADALLAGCAAFLVKPVPLADFLRAVQALMSSEVAVPVQPAQVRRDGLRSNPQFADGWLTFESGEEKRRLSPTGWTRSP